MISGCSETHTLRAAQEIESFRNFLTFLSALSSLPKGLRLAIDELAKENPKAKNITQQELMDLNSLPLRATLFIKPWQDQIIYTSFPKICPSQSMTAHAIIWSECAFPRSPFPPLQAASWICPG
jgi:hypothetical protein